MGKHVMQAQVEQARVESAGAVIKHRRRWVTLVVTSVIVLALYAGALSWVNQRLQTDIRKSIHTLPTVNQDHSGGE